MIPNDKFFFMFLLTPLISPFTNKGISIRKNTLISIALFVLSMLAATGSTYFFVNLQKDDAAVINLAGRQRMLTMLIKNDALEMDFAHDLNMNMKDVSDKLTDHVELFDLNLKTIRNGGIAKMPDGRQVMIGNPSVSVIPYLERLEMKWAGLKRHLDVLLEPGVAADSEPFLKAIEAITIESQDVLAISDEITSFFQHDSEKKITIIKYVQIVSLLLTCLLGLLVYMYVRTGIIQPVSEMYQVVKSIGDNDLTARTRFISDSEIGDLGRGINDMADRLADDRRDMDIKNKRLVEMSRLKSEFTANVSHELNTPLSVIIGFSEIILQEIGDRLTDDQKTYLAGIMEGGHALTERIRDLLNFSELEAGLVKINIGSVLANGVVDEVIAFEKNLAGGKDIRFINEIDKDLVIYVDEGKFRHILLNLINNSVKFTESGEIKVSARIEAGGEAIISISDTGIGIPAEAHELIFEPFRQIDGSHTRNYGGTGLGLAIAQRYVQLHGGRVWVESEPGNGTTVFFTIPQHSHG